MTTRTRPRRAPDRGSPLEGIVTAALRRHEGRQRESHGRARADRYCGCHGRRLRQFRSSRTLDRRSCHREGERSRFPSARRRRPARWRMGARRPARCRRPRDASPRSRVLQSRAHVGDGCSVALHQGCAVGGCRGGRCCSEGRSCFECSARIWRWLACCRLARCWKERRQRREACASQIGARDGGSSGRLARSASVGGSTQAR